MIEMTFKEYDELIDRISMLDENTMSMFTYPDIEDAEKYIETRESMVILITAAEKTTDPEYKKELNAILRTHLKLTDSSGDEPDESAGLDVSKLGLSKTAQCKIEKIIDKHNKVNLHIPSFCPTIGELDDLAEKVDFKKDEAAVGFFLWVSDLDKEPESGENIIKVSKHARKLLKQRLLEPRKHK